MEFFARLAGAKKTEFLPIHRPSSNFDLVEDRLDGLWPVRRIFSQARLSGATSCVIEELLPSRDLVEENEDLAKICLGFSGEASEVLRVAFFDCSVSQKNIHRVKQESFLGYFIYKKDYIPRTPEVYEHDEPKCRVYESAIRHNRHDNNFVHGSPSWTCRVGGKYFQINGYLYAQQNTITNSCAHVAIRTAASRFTGDDLSYRKINNWVSDYRQQKQLPDVFPGMGLSNAEICHVLEKAGARTFVGDYSRPNKQLVPYQRFLYGSIESGFPAILFFGMGEKKTDEPEVCHVIPLFGHTFNEDTWVADADIMYFQIEKVTRSLSSGTWVSMFIGHDDNAGSNYCIPQHYLDAKRFCKNDNKVAKCKQQEVTVAYAIGTLPESIQVDPIEAEVTGIDYLVAVLNEIPQNPDNGSGRWHKRLVYYHNRNLLVTRAILITGREYAKHLSLIRGWDVSERIPKWIPEAMENVADDFFWMVELSIPELFSTNKRKVGEILIRASNKPSTKRDFSSFFCARLPSYFVLFDPDQPQDTVKSGNPNFFFSQVPIQDHVGLYGCESDQQQSSCLRIIWLWALSLVFFMIVFYVLLANL